MKNNKSFTPLILAAVLGLASTTALADAGHGKGTAFGKPGKTSAASRVVDIQMGDSFYEPGTVTVKKGETIHFKVRNDGEMVHEFAIGTRKTHMGHQAEMMKMMDAGVLGVDSIDHDKMKHGGMMHDDPNSVLLEPGKSGEVVWTFDNDATIEFACNIPGHYEGGMVGQVRFE